jgi:hypothetical protein
VAGALSGSLESRGAMPVYFLHLRESGERIEDPQGTEFPSLMAARAEAIRSAREMMAESLRAGQPLDHQQIEICDASGELLEVVRFRDVLKAISG